jgi:hypothetical protein
VERAETQLAKVGRIATEVRIKGLREKHLVSVSAWEEAQTISAYNFVGAYALS